jgi:hypothetical protein
MQCGGVSHGKQMRFNTTGDHYQSTELKIIHGPCSMGMGGEIFYLLATNCLLAS